MIYKVKRILKCLRGKKKKKRHNNPAGLPSASHQGQDSVTGRRGPGDLPSSGLSRAENPLQSRDLEPKTFLAAGCGSQAVPPSPQQGCGHPLTVPRATGGLLPILVSGTAPSQEPGCGAGGCTAQYGTARSLHHHVPLRLSVHSADINCLI